MISYQADGIKMPAIKKRETTEWIKAVAASYEKESVKSPIFLLGRENSRSKPAISSA